MFRLVCASLLAVWGAGFAAAAEKQPAAKGPHRTDVFVAGLEGYHTYRIPSVIVTPRNGHLLAICEGRKNNRRDHGDIDLVAKRSTDGGKTWSDLQLVYEEGGTKEITIGNPCPVTDRATGTIWLPFCRDNDDVFVTKSTDDGKAWSEPVKITANVKQPEWGWYATGPGVGIQLTQSPHEGRLVIPCDHRLAGPGAIKNSGASHVFYSNDHGKTWKLGGVTDKAMNECQVVELADGRLMLNMRSYRGHGRRAVALSDDGGESWSKCVDDETLIEPVCQASFLRYTREETADRNRLLFSNPASTDTRHRLTVRLSYDEGESWPVSRMLHPGPSAYSCLTVMPDKSIGILYEGGKKHPYERLIFARFGLDWLTKGEDSLDGE